MAKIELTKENFDSTITENEIVVVDFWAEWCGPCRAFKPVFEKAAAKHTDVAFAACDTEAEPELAGAFQIRSIPTVMVFRQKVLVFAQPGALPAEALDELITKVKELDMEQVHTEVARHQEQQAAAGGR
jgi:thioredoxin 1